MRTGVLVPWPSRCDILAKGFSAAEWSAWNNGTCRRGLARLQIAEPGPPAWTKKPGAFLNDVDVGPEGVSPRDGTNNLAEASLTGRLPLAVPEQPDGGDEGIASRRFFLPQCRVPRAGRNRPWEVHLSRRKQKYADGIFHGTHATDPFRANQRKTDIPGLTATSRTDLSEGVLKT
mgnify:CR=1 FL=1